MWYVYAIEYCSAIKENEIMPFEAMWIDVEIVILSEAVIEKGEILCKIFYMWKLKKGYK